MDPITPINLELEATRAAMNRLNPLAQDAQREIILLEHEREGLLKETT